MLMRKRKTIIITSLICLISGMLSGAFTSVDDYVWYAGLNKPWFTPPNWLFAPVWIIMYIIIGIIVGKLWQHRNKFYNILAIKLFIIHFIFNLIWSPIFFCFHRIDIAFYDICLVWFSLMMLCVVAWKNKLIIILLLPYMAWTSFATILNYSIYILN